MTEYWLADHDGRILGPVGLPVLQDLINSGRVQNIKTVSTDGMNFVPLNEMPEVSESIKSGAKSAQERSADAARQLRSWLENIRGRPTHEVFRVPETSPLQSYRSAFFSLVRRYYPDRLPADASVELRQMCEEVFLHLAGRMVDVERQRRSTRTGDVPTQPPLDAALANHPTEIEATWRGGVLHMSITLRSHDVSMFTIHPEFNFTHEAFFVASSEAVIAGTPAEVQFHFHGTPAHILARGRVVKSAAAPSSRVPSGFGVKLTELPGKDREFIRSFITQAG